MFAIEQCLLCLGHHPAVWHQAAHFLELSSKILTEKGDVNAAKNLSDEAATMFERATNTLLSKNMLLYFAHADFEEGRVKYEKVHQIYQKFLDIPDIDPTLVCILMHYTIMLTDVLKYLILQAYVQYMKFARRAEGIKSARTVFKRAREDTRCKHHVYVAAALMEYYCTKDKNIAFRIFELGLKKFADNPDYILCYIDYLSHLNGKNFTMQTVYDFSTNAIPNLIHPSLLQRITTREFYSREYYRLVAWSRKNQCMYIISRISLYLMVSKNIISYIFYRDIWNRFLEFESNIGDLASIVKVEKRRSAVLEKVIIHTSINNIDIIIYYEK